MICHLLSRKQEKPVVKCSGTISFYFILLVVCFFVCFLVVYFIMIPEAPRIKRAYPGLGVDKMRDPCSRSEPERKNTFLHPLLLVLLRILTLTGDRIRKLDNTQLTGNRIYCTHQFKPTDSSRQCLTRYMGTSDPVKLTKINIAVSMKIFQDGFCCTDPFTLPLSLLICCVFSFLSKCRYCQVIQV